MVKTVSTAKARANFGDVLNSVFYTKEPVIVEKKGKVVAVIISPDEYERYRQQRLDQAWATIQALQERNGDNDPDTVLREVTAEVEAVRQQMYDERQTR